MLRPKIVGADFDKITDGFERDIAGFVTGAMRDTTGDVKDAFRDEVRRAGLGDRLANAIRGVTYPQAGDSLEPAGWIFAQPSKDGRGAAAIIDSYARGATIYPRAGKQFLAIPTEDTPRKRQGDALTPDEVERKFGRRLTFIDPKDKGFRTPSIRKRGVGFLVMKDLVVRKATGRWRKASQREREGRTRNPRPLSAVIMFTLVPSVKKPQSVNLLTPEGAANSFDRHLSDRWR